MLINLIDKNCAKILLLSIMGPGKKYNRKEIQKWTMMNNVPLDYSINKLLFLKILKEKDRLYSLNLEHNFVKSLLEERELLVNLPFEVQFALIEFINEVLKFRGIVKVLLFGSYSKLIFTAKSDIDLAVILYDKFKNKTILEKKIFKITEKVSKKYKKHIETHFFEEKDLKHKEDPLIKDILRDGIVLI